MHMLSRHGNKRNPELSCADKVYQGRLKLYTRNNL